jgi:hypothetical protein
MSVFTVKRRLGTASRRAFLEVFPDWQSVKEAM